MVYTFSIKLKGEKTRIPFLGIGQFQDRKAFTEAVKYAAGFGLAEELDFRTLKMHDEFWPRNIFLARESSVTMLEYTLEDLMGAK